MIRFKCDKCQETFIESESSCDTDTSGFWYVAFCPKCGDSLWVKKERIQTPEQEYICKEAMREIIKIF